MTSIHFYINHTNGSTVRTNFLSFILVVLTLKQEICFKQEAGEK